MSGRAVVRVRPKQLKRMTAWEVRCSICPNLDMVTKWKDVAETIATAHLRDCHEGNGVVAVRKP